MNGANHFYFNYGVCVDNNSYTANIGCQRETIPELDQQ